jgi:hypothetical protein
MSRATYARFQRWRLLILASAYLRMPLLRGRTAARRTDSRARKAFRAGDACRVALERQA